jgi:hypothetical protein
MKFPRPFPVAGLFVASALLVSNVAAQAAGPIVTNIAMVPRLIIQSDLGITNQIQCCSNLSQPNCGQFELLQSIGCSRD